VFAGIRAGTARGYLRCSVVGDPIARRTLPTDAAGVVHIDLVEGAGVKLTVASKGFGAENMSALRMFTPADGIDAVKQFVVDTVDHAGANACPPVILRAAVSAGLSRSPRCWRRRRRCAHRFGDIPWRLWRR
jgi:fumarate hydratase subunit alpha